MATIPTIDGPNVQQGGLPGVRLTTQASTDGIGDALSGAADVANRRDLQAKRDAEIARDKANQVRLIEADRQLGEWRNQALYDPKTGALNQKGKNALGVRNPTIEDFDKHAGELLAGASTQEQRDGLQRMIGRERVSVDLALQQHVAGQSQVYENANDDASLTTARENALAAAAHGDWTGVSDGIQRQKLIIASASQRQGLGAEAQNERTARAMSDTHAGIISNLLDTDQDLHAEKYFQLHRDEILGSDRAKVEKALEISSLRGKSQGLVDDLMAEKGEDGQGLTLDAGLAKIAEATKDDPRVREQAEQRWEAMHGKRLQAAAQAADAAFEDGFRTLKAGSFDDIKPTTLAAMGAEHELRLRSLAAKGPPQHSDRGAIAYLDRLAVDHPEEFGKSSTVLKYSDVLSDEDFKKYSGLSATVAKEGSKAPKLVELRSRQEVVESTLRGFYGAEKKDWPKDAWQAEDRFNGLLEKAMEDESANLKPGETLGNQKVKELADRLLVEEAQKNPRGWFNNWIVHPFGDSYSTEQVPAFNRPGASKLAISVAQVPEKWRKNIEAAIRAQPGGVVSEAAVVSAYNDAVGRANATP